VLEVPSLRESAREENNYLSMPDDDIKEEIANE
jgi:hypothetical protein